MPLTRQRYSSSSRYGGMPPGVKWLIIVNASLFVPYFVGGAALENVMNMFLALSVETTLRHLFVWQIATYLFLHGGLLHLVFNMLSLWFFGVQLERDWGTRQFVKYYFLCGIAAGVCVLAVNYMFGYEHMTLGASGAIFGILVAFGVLYPDSTVLMNFLFPIKAKYMVMIYAGIELLMTFRPNTGVSTVAHLGGMVFGYLYLKRSVPRLRVRTPSLKDAYKQWKLARAKRKFQVYLRRQQDKRGPFVN